MNSNWLVDAAISASSGLLGGLVTKHISKARHYKNRTDSADVQSCSPKAQEHLWVLRQGGSLASPEDLVSRKLKLADELMNDRRK